MLFASSPHVNWARNLCKISIPPLCYRTSSCIARGPTTHQKPSSLNFSSDWNCKELEKSERNHVTKRSHTEMVKP